jgi:DHA3 family macrolide efflux protein-like MFS transporter
MAPAGLMIAGPVSDRWGIQVWFLLGGAACSLMGVVGLLIPAVMQIEEQQHVAAQPGLGLASPQ